MAKITSMNGAHAQAETFDPLLPVELVLPFPGHWGQIRAVYGFAAVQDLADNWDTVMSDIHPLAVAADEQAAAADTPEAKQAAAREQRRMKRELSLRIIGLVVQRFTWPFKGNPPDPRHPDEFTQWPDLVLMWLAEGALIEVRKRVDDPKLWAGSAAT